MKSEIIIDNKLHKINIQGDFFWGKNEILFEKNSKIIEFSKWKEVGYKSLKTHSQKNHNKIKLTLNNLLFEILERKKIKVDKKFNLENYHKYVSDNNLHNEIIKETRSLTLSMFPKEVFHEILFKISSHLNKKLTFYNKELEKEIIILRLSRPSNLDINPPHRDGYLKVWKDVLNVWIPICGCNSNSSLPVIPYSHKTNEKDILRTSGLGATINKNKYHVPAIVSMKNGLKMKRPNPKYGESLIFTPFLVHGSAINENKDKTRVSLELRLCDEEK